MIVDLHDTPDADLPEVDVCVVGSGPAGTTLARELVGSGLRTAVLESGRLRPTRHGDALRTVRSEGAVPIKDYSRERVLGGASSTWAGLSSPLDRVELEPRPGPGIPGWPIGRDELLRFWRRAADDYRFAPLRLYEPGGFDVVRAQGDAAPTWEELEEKVFLAAAEPQHFGKEHRHVFEGGETDLFLDATLVRLVSERDADGERVVRGVVRSSDGRERTIAARAFVLATGGLENARVLLNSPGPDGVALGNAHDQVGRCLMNHPKAYHGVIRLAEPVRELPLLFGCLHKGYAGYAGLRLPDATQERLGLLNAYVRFEPLFPWSDNLGVESFVYMAKRSTKLLGAWKRRKQDEVVTLRDYSETGDDSDLQNARKGVLDRLALVGHVVLHAPSVVRYLFARVTGRAPLVRRVRVRNFMEMEPHPDNRVTLGDARDANGEPETVVRHGPTERDKESLCVLHDVLARELERTGFGVLESSLRGADPWPVDLDASHHLGTTRMGTDPASSVTDPTGRVHGVANVWCAGGSLFPTSGCANPTLTIVALSIRMAEHLRAALGGGAAASVGAGAGDTPGEPVGSARVVSDAVPSPGASGVTAGPASGARRRVLVVGAGGRVVTDVLPALRSLPDRYEVAGVFARSRRALEDGTPTRDFRSLTDEDVAAADLVYVAVSKPATARVLDRLAQHEVGHVDLLVDTPVLAFKHLGHLAAFDAFRAAWVAEDCTTLPWLPLVGSARAAWLGPLREVEFDRSAYRYHGFALLRTLFDGASPRSARRRRIAGGARLELRFAGGRRGTVIEPRDYAAGTWRMTGEGGVLVDRADVAPPGAKVLELVRDGDVGTGFRIDGDVLELTPEESRFLGPVAPADTVTARTEDLKRVGLRRLLVDVAEGRGAYDLWHGLDDMLVEYALDRVGRWRAGPLTSLERPTARKVLGGVLGLVSR